MAKGNWSKYNPKPRCFSCGKALSKKAIRHNPQGLIACESHAAQQSVQADGAESDGEKYRRMVERHSMPGIDGNIPPRR